MSALISGATGRSGQRRTAPPTSPAATYRPSGEYATDWTLSPEGSTSDPPLVDSYRDFALVPSCRNPVPPVAPFAAASARATALPSGRKLTEGTLSPYVHVC